MQGLVYKRVSFGKVNIEKRCDYNLVLALIETIQGVV